MSEAPYYQVEEIVGFKNIRGVPHYKIRWQGYSRHHDSWEPSSNLTACGQLIDEYNARKASPPKTRRTTRRSVAGGKTLAELSPEGVPTLRRSQRARTPTCYFVSEATTTTTTTSQRKQQPAQPTKPAKKTTSPKKRQHREEEEEDTDEEEFDVQRSEYELRSQFATRRSPRRLEEIHYFNSELPVPRQSAKGGSATTAVLSSDEEEERGGQESTTTTTTTSQRKQQPAQPTKPAKKTTSPKKRQRREEEEEDTDEEEFDVQRSEYELRSQFATRRSPRRLEEIHYFNSELPVPRQSAKGGSATTAVLSSDEEEERGGQESLLTPQVSVYESRVRKKLSSLSSLTRKKVTEALTSITNREDNKSASSAVPGTSQPTEPPPSSSALHVYETRSHASQPPPKEPLTSSLSPVVAQRKTHSSTTVTTTTTATVPSVPKTRDQMPSSLDNTTDSPPDITPFDPPSSSTSKKVPPVLPSSPTTENVPQWMKFGWEEAFFIFIVICLSIFAYYCFYSINC